ncbi:septum formation inhibitor Maf [Campylobacter sp. faydin G-24]|uniref:Nucleoside triphosphate pyrophosphatase n=1 Tax=Campylobacter anatolicus TaxID=2829105 RepID=A0ABS5HI30_9BACT|nr:septum formation inhibitor Maf [Campylobacter anatolicus]MBR8463783.1 septum formation inhibitor Maf [Campylobacter anatolicus]MBR8464815.1 septum formation inhibitor Maf [Campylobacter anatolicus]
MIILASSSPTRAKILSENGIEFQQISFNFDESGISKTYPPNIYVQMVIKAKKEQFLKIYPNLKNVLIADSCVSCNDKILGKAKDECHARQMLKLQSNNFASVFSAFVFMGEKFEVINVSQTQYKFDNFSDDEIDKYIKSGEYIGKAGAMMVEGFNKNHIIKQIGNTNNARGLNIELLKAFL